MLFPLIAFPGLLLLASHGFPPASLWLLPSSSCHTAASSFLPHCHLPSLSHRLPSHCASLPRCVRHFCPAVLPPPLSSPFIPFFPPFTPPLTAMRSNSSSTASSMFSSTSTTYSFGSTSSPAPLTAFSQPSPSPLHPTLDPVYLPPASLLSLASPSWPSYAQTSLTDLSTDQEEARRQRVEARRRAAREREQLQPDLMGRVEPQHELMRAASPIALRALPLSPPSPTPSLRSWRGDESLRPTAGRQLWPNSASPPLLEDDEEQEKEPAKIPRLLQEGGGVGASCSLPLAEAWKLRGEGERRPHGMISPDEEVSDRQRQQESDQPHTLAHQPLDQLEDGDERDGKQSPPSALASGQRLSPSFPTTVHSPSLTAPPRPHLPAGAHLSRVRTPRSAVRPLSSSDPFPTSLSSSPLPAPHISPSSPASTAPSSVAAAILYVHSVVSTSPADTAGLRVRDLIVEIGGFSRQKGWHVNMIEDVARLIRSWPHLHPGQPLRIEVLRRITPEQAQGPLSVVWARLKTGGNGDGDGRGGVGEEVIALQPLLLWPLIGRWQLSEQKAGEGGGVLGAVLVALTAFTPSPHLSYPPHRPLAAHTAPPLCWCAGRSTTRSLFRSVLLHPLLRPRLLPPPYAHSRPRLDSLPPAPLLLRSRQRLR